MGGSSSATLNERLSTKIIERAPGVWRHQLFENYHKPPYIHVVPMRWHVHSTSWWETLSSSPRCRATDPTASFLACLEINSSRLSSKNCQHATSQRGLTHSHANALQTI